MKQEMIDKYAKLILSALNDNKGPKKGDVILIRVPESAKPLMISLRNECLKQECHPIVRFLPQNMSKEFYDLANPKQLKFFPDKYIRGLVDEIDHLVSIISEVNKHELKDVNPKKIMTSVEANKKFREWLEEKENKGKFTWTLALYPTKQMADEVKTSLKKYTNQVVKACFLDLEDPVKEWKARTKEIERIKNKLNKLKIEWLHIKSQGTDLKIKIGPDRKWMGGSGRNVPSFEIFISPDWRGTQGKISFDQPLYRYGNLIQDISLEFKNGKVVKSKASKGQKVLKEMIKTKNADKVGEFSLTDTRFSRITEFMGETLYDENVGGKYGNTHIALGNAYKDSFPGDPSKVSPKKWKEMGYNESSVHTDIVSTKDRVVTATLKDGSQKIIFKDGKFMI